MAKPTPSFEQNVAEIEQILEEIESASMPIDALASKVERAATLIRTCRSVLTRTESRVSEAIQALTADGGDDARPSVGDRERDAFEDDDEEDEETPF